MDTKIVYAIIISVILGGSVGFSISYGVFNVQLQNLQNELQTVSDEYDALSSARAKVSDNIITGVKIDLRGKTVSLNPVNN